MHGPAHLVPSSGAHSEALPGEFCGARCESTLAAVVRPA